MQNANLLFALGSLVFSLLLLFCNVLLIIFNEGDASHQSGQVIFSVEILKMGRSKTQVREDVGACSRLRDMSANLDQVGSTDFLFAFVRCCFSGAPFQMIEGICVLSGC